MLPNATEFLIVPRLLWAFCPVILYRQTHTYTSMHTKADAQFWTCIPCASIQVLLRLQVIPRLVLGLCGGEVILQEALQVLKGGSLLRLFSPAVQHQLMQGVRAVRRAGHPVAPLHLV